MKGQLRREMLGDGTGIYVTDDYTFGTDAVLLAGFAASFGRVKRACDLGCGGGIIPLLLAARGAAASLTGVELQEGAVELFRRSLAERSPGIPVEAVQGDLRRYSVSPGQPLYDLVTCNPPYKLPGTGQQCRGDARTIARFEVECRLQDVCEAAARITRHGGRFVLCHRPERLCDLMVTLRACGLEPKVVRFASMTEVDSPWLVLVSAVKGAKPGLKVLPPLFVHRNGDFSDEYKDYYGEVFGR